MSGVGSQEMRIVERKDKNNTPLVIGFAEFTDAHRANVALKALQVSNSSHSFNGPCTKIPEFLHSKNIRPAPKCGFSLSMNGISLYGLHILSHLAILANISST